jgi:hypothetical protein
MAYGLAHKGKATSDVTFSPDDPLESYNNSSVYTRISSYASEARSILGPEWDPNTDDIDGPTVMRIGQGKKHGWYWLGDGTLESGSVQPSPRSKQRPRPEAQPYANGRPLHNSGSMHSRFVLFNSSYIDLYIT